MRTRSRTAVTLLQVANPGTAGVIQIPWYDHSDEVDRFVQDVYAAKLVRSIDWMRWTGTPGARRLMENPTKIAHATQDDVIYLLTTIIRGDRFGDGEIASAVDDGTLLAIAERTRAFIDDAGGSPRSHGPLWDRMDAHPRTRAALLTRRSVPADPSVHARYRRRRAVYVGKADDPRDRIWSRHLGQSRTMGTSALRWNVAEFLGFGLSADIKAQRIQLAAEQLAVVREWILGCNVTWIACPLAPAAIALESRMKEQWMPPLTKQ
jgi:hypothetical protein